jgi:hypothetical protein
MNWLYILLGVFVILGFRRPGRMGSTHVGILVASAVALGWVYLRLGG